MLVFIKRLLKVRITGDPIVAKASSRTTMEYITRSSLRNDRSTLYFKTDIQIPQDTRAVWKFGIKNIRPMCKKRNEWSCDANGISGSQSNVPSIPEVATVALITINGFSWNDTKSFAREMRNRDFSTRSYHYSHLRTFKRFLYNIYYTYILYILHINRVNERKRKGCRSMNENNKYEWVKIQKNNPTPRR